MPFDPQIAINLYYPAANSAYLIQTVPAPPLPAGFTLAGPLMADPNKAAAMMAAAPAAQHAMVNAMLADSNIFGLVAWNAAAKTAMVAFRGTQDAKDWLDDLDVVPVDYQAVAVLSGFDIARNMVAGSVPEFCTFAAPRSVDPGFSGKFNAAFPMCNRIVNFMDVVPQVPLPPLYEHVGQEQEVHGGFKPLDIVYAHRLTTYLAGLQKLTSAAG